MMKGIRNKKDNRRRNRRNKVTEEIGKMIRGIKRSSNKESKNSF